MREGDGGGGEGREGEGVEKGWEKGDGGGEEEGEVKL